jgi:ABC-type multidrug transport system ATPase subunit
MMHNPDVLIMDEPTAGLDPNQIRQFRNYIRELGKTKTILISTHILQEVDAVATRVLFIHDGRLIFDGNPDDLKEDGSLERPFYEMTNFGRPLELNRVAAMPSGLGDVVPSKQDSDGDVVPDEREKP